MMTSCVHSIADFVRLTSQHVVVRVICDGVDVRRRLGAAFALVGGDHGGRVDRQPFVGIHRHTEEPRVGLRKRGNEGQSRRACALPTIVVAGGLT